MDRETLKKQVQTTISGILDKEDERIELMEFARLLKEKGIESKLHYNEKINKIMGFGLDLEGEHFQGHEVAIPWQSIRNRIILPEAMQKLDKPTFTLSAATESDGDGYTLPIPVCSREEALEAARRRAPGLFEGFEMSEDEDGWGLFSVNGEVQFCEPPDGKRIIVNQESYEAIAAAIVYGNARWGEGNVLVTSKDPKFIEKCLRSADEYGIQIANREELERIINGDIQSKPQPKDKPAVPFSTYAETLEKLVEYEGYASLGENEQIKAGLREKLNEMAQEGVLVGPEDMKKLADKISDQIGYPEQAELAAKYLQKIGYEANFEDQDSQRLGMW